MKSLAFEVKIYGAALDFHQHIVVFHLNDLVFHMKILAFHISQVKNWAHCHQHIDSHEVFHLNGLVFHTKTLAFHYISQVKNWVHFHKLDILDLFLSSARLNNSLVPEAFQGRKWAPAAFLGGSKA